MSVLDLRGPEFLTLYSALLAGSIVVGLLFRRLLRGPSDLPPVNYNLDRFQTAYLARHIRGAVDTAIAGLVHRRVLKAWGGRPPVLKTADPLPSDHAALERAVYSAVSPGAAGTNLRDVREGAKPTAERIGEPLVRLALVLPPGRYAVLRLVPVLMLLGLLGLGIAKFVIGISRNRPVFFVAILCIMTFVTAVMMFQRCHRRTIRGSKLLKKLQKDNEPLRVSATAGARSLAYTDMALAFGLFGPAALASSDEDLRNALRPPSSGSSCGSSSCGSSSCGSSSCGGSGCGGGGCGGCGGGD